MLAHAAPAAAGPIEHPATLVWDGHFIDPARAMERVREVLDR